MDTVRITDSAIEIQEVFQTASADGCSPVALFVGRKQTFENNVLLLETGVCDRQRAEGLLYDVCQTVRSRKNVIRIAIHCKFLFSLDEPCIVVACSAADYQQASEAVEETVRCIASLKVKAEPESDAVTVADSCKDVDEVVSNMVQVKANKAEIKTRINAFIERKREKINFENIRDFCCHKTTTEQENSCARVDAVLIHRKDSKSHVRVRRVFNSWGPQTRVLDKSSEVLPEYTDFRSINPLKSGEKAAGIEERLRNVEEHIGIMESSVPEDVYSRLKKVEDRVLYLEGLSPEYCEFWHNTSSTSAGNRAANMKKRTYSKEDLARKIKELQNKLALGQAE